MRDEQVVVNRLRFAPGTVIQIVIYVITLAMAYSTIDKRITKLEDRYERTAQDIGEIRVDVKQLLRYLRP